MAYVLATTETAVRWYVPRVKSGGNIMSVEAGEFDLLDTLNLNLVPGFGNKETAKRVALALGLKTWRYVKIDTPLHTYTF